MNTPCSGYKKLHSVVLFVSCMMLAYMLSVHANANTIHHSQLHSDKSCQHTTICFGVALTQGCCWHSRQAHSRLPGTPTPPHMCGPCWWPAACLTHPQEAAPHESVAAASTGRFTKKLSTANRHARHAKAIVHLGVQLGTAVHMGWLDVESPCHPWMLLACLSRSLLQLAVTACEVHQLMSDTVTVLVRKVTACPGCYSKVTCRPPAGCMRRATPCELQHLPMQQCPLAG